jgi:hypothetical protein
LVAGTAELLDDRIYSEQEFKNLIPVAILSQIPDISTVSEMHRRSRVALMKNLACVCIVLAILAGSALSYLRG